MKRMILLFVFLIGVACVRRMLKQRSLRIRVGSHDLRQTGIAIRGPVS